jgi:hypothetical protein
MKRSDKKREEHFRETLGGTMTRPSANIQVADRYEVKRTLSALLGLTALALAVSGIIPALSPGAKVWGLFEVNGLHTSVHFLAAAGALYAAYLMNDTAVKIWKGAAIFFGALTLLGLLAGNGHILGLVANNGHDIWMHALKTAAFAYLGWSRQPDNN